MDDRLRRAVTSTRLWLALILVVAALLRVLGTRFGFPLLLHPDEWAVVEGAIDMAKRNSFEPAWSLRPDHLEMKIDYIVFAAYAIIAGSPIEMAFEADPVPFYWMARLVTATFGVGTVAVAFLIGNRYSSRLGLIAATAFAIFPPFVEHAFYATPDVPLTFCTLLLAYLLMRYWDSPTWIPLLGASLALALAVSIKYPGALGSVAIGAIVIAAAVRDRRWIRIITHGAGSAAASVVFLFLISPVLFTNLSGIRRELEHQAEGDRLGHPDLGLFGNMAFYASTFTHSSGFLVVLLAVVGAVFAVSRRQAAFLPWLIGLVYWIALSALPMTWPRWGLPMWVTPLLFASFGVEMLVQRFRSRRTQAIPIVLAAVVLVQWATMSTGILAGALAPDTRAAALAVTKEHNITPRNAVYEGYSPLRPEGPELFFKRVEPTADGYTFKTKDEREATYIILSSGMYGRVMTDPAYGKEQRIYRWIFANTREFARFAPLSRPVPSYLEPVNMWRSARFLRSVADGGMTGPMIRIFKRDRVQPDGTVPP